jgi:hypothetical protein
MSDTSCLSKLSCQFCFPPENLHDTTVGTNPGLRLGNERSATLPLTQLRDKLIHTFSLMPPLVVDVRRGRHELFQLFCSRKKKHKMRDKLKQRARNRFLVWVHADSASFEREPWAITRIVCVNIEILNDLSGIARKASAGDSMQMSLDISEVCKPNITLLQAVCIRRELDGNLARQKLGQRTFASPLAQLRT